MTKRKNDKINALSGDRGDEGIPEKPLTFSPEEEEYFHEGHAPKPNTKKGRAEKQPKAKFDGLVKRF